MFNLFIVSTPRHWLLSIYLAQNDFFGQKNVVFIEPDFPIEDIYLKLSKQYFSKVVFLPKGGSKKKIKTVKAIFNQYGVQNVISGAIKDPFVQFAAHLLHKQQNDTCFYLLDDGLFSYHPSNTDMLGKLEVLNRKLRFGFWYCPPFKFNLASPWVDKAFLLRPDIVGSNENKDLIKIDSKWFEKLKKLGLFDDFLTSFNVKVAEVENISVLFILRQYKDGIASSNFYGDDLNKIFNYLDKSNIKFAVKYHPRDRFSDPLNVSKNFSNHLVLPGKLPFEALIGVLPEKAIVLGDVSTVLLELKNLNPEMDIQVSLLGSTHLDALPILEAAEIKVLSRFSDFEL